MIPALTAAIESLYPDYTVQSYDILWTKPEVSEDLYCLQNLRLDGRSKLSACGRFDGMPIQMIVADSRMPYAGYLIRVSRQMELCAEGTAKP